MAICGRVVKAMAGTAEKACPGTWHSSAEYQLESKCRVRSLCGQVQALCAILIDMLKQSMASDNAWQVVCLQQCLQLSIGSLTVEWGVVVS